MNVSMNVYTYIQKDPGVESDAAPGPPYVSIRQHMSEYSKTWGLRATRPLGPNTSAYVSICQNIARPGG